MAAYYGFLWNLIQIEKLQEWLSILATNNLSAIRPHTTFVGNLKKSCRALDGFFVGFYPQSQDIQIFPKFVERNP